MQIRQLNQLSIRHHLTIGFSLVVALMVSIAALAYYQLTSTAEHLQTLLSGQAKAAATVREIAASVGASYISALSAAVANTPEDAKYQQDEMKAARQRATQAEATMKQLLTAHSDAAPLLADLDQVRQYRTQAESSVAQMEHQMGVAEERDALIGNIAYSAQPLFASWQGAAVKLEENLAKKAAEDGISARNDVEYKRWLFLLIAGTGVVCALGSGWMVSRAVGAPVKEALTLAENVAQGRLSSIPTRQHVGEVGAIVDALTRMQNSLRTLVQQVYTSTEGIVGASSEIAAGNEDLSQRTETTASHLQVASSSMQQISETVRQTATTAEEANRLASQAAQAAVRGGEVVQQVVDNMKEISLSSARISEITGMIDAIAFQTNILALNAAVEAARASEHGRGFAVVAGEVRSLAHRSATAAREIKELIAGSLEKVSSGSRLVEDAGQTMNEIVSSVQSVSSLIAEISSATTGQSSELSQVNNTVASLDDMTRQNSALVEQTTAASSSLSDQARRLQDIISVFELTETSTVS